MNLKEYKIKVIETWAQLIQFFNQSLKLFK